MNSADDVARHLSTSSDEAARLREVVKGLVCDLYRAYPGGVTVDEIEEIVNTNRALAQFPSVTAGEFALRTLGVMNLMQDQDVDAIDVACAL